MRRHNSADLCNSCNMTYGVHSEKKKNLRYENDYCHKPTAGHCCILTWRTFMYTEKLTILLHYGHTERKSNSFYFTIRWTVGYFLVPSPWAHPTSKATVLLMTAECSLVIYTIEPTSISWMRKAKNCEHIWAPILLHKLFRYFERFTSIYLSSYNVKNRLV